MKRSGFKPRIKPLASILRTATLTMSKPKLAAKPRMRKCAICRLPFAPMSMTHKACGPACAQAVAAAARIKTERKADAAKLIEMKPPKWWRAKAKTALHAFIRARDEGKACISCDTILVKRGRPGGDYDAGHFRSVGSAKHLEFEENNIHGQCKQCNNFGAGMAFEYERRLAARCGQAYVDAIKCDQAPRHYDISDFMAIEVTYKAKRKQLLAGRKN